MNSVKDSVFRTVEAQLNQICSMDFDELSTKELSVISDDLDKIIAKLCFFGLI